MATTQSFLLPFCFILIFIDLDRCNTYVNEICFPDNWMVIKGNWSFSNNTNGPCGITTALSTSNIAVLPYKSWTYLNYIQNPSYQFEIEYNFTITAASANNTIGSAGVIWFPDAGPNENHDYIGVSFNKNEAFAAATRGTDPDPYYDNMQTIVSSENGEVVWITINRGALPLTLSINTFYSLHIEIYSIAEGYAQHDVYINNLRVFRRTRTYSSVFEHNTSWIGLKSSNAAVISHSLTVHQASNPSTGDSAIQYFNWTSKLSMNTTDEPNPSTSNANISASETTDTNPSTTDRNPSTTTQRVFHESGRLISQLLDRDLTVLYIILAFVVLCICCCSAAILVLWRTPNKKTQNIDNNGHDMQHVQGEGEPALIIPSLPDTVSDIRVAQNITTHGSMSNSKSKDVVMSNGIDGMKPAQSGEIALRRMHTPDGDGIHCGVCGVMIIDNTTPFSADGVIHCSVCYVLRLKKQESVTTEGLCDDGEDTYNATKTFKETLSPQVNTQKVTSRINICEECGHCAIGKADEDGSFFCNECWQLYCDHNTKRFIQ
eukprot:257235_1